MLPPLLWVATHYHDRHSRRLFQAPDTVFIFRPPLLILPLLVVTPLCYPHRVVLPRSRHLFKAPPPLHETALPLPCLRAVALPLLFPGAEHPQLPYRLHPSLSGPRRWYNEPICLNLVHCPGPFLFMTSMLLPDHEISPFPFHHHTTIMQTKTVSPLMRYLLTRMTGWLRRHYALLVLCTLYLLNFLLTTLSRHFISWCKSSPLGIPCSNIGTRYTYSLINFLTNTAFRRIQSITR